MNNKKIYVLLIAVFLCLVGSDCFADSGGWSGNNNFTTASSSNPWGGGTTSPAGIHQYQWYHFKFLGTSGTEGQEVRIVPQWGNDDNKVPVVSGSCASTDVGFWILALGTNGAKKDWDNIAADPALPMPWYTNETENEGNPVYPKGGYFYVNTSIGTEDAGCWKMGSKYNCNTSGTAHYYRGRFAPYDTLSINNVSEGSITYDPTAIAEQRLYKKIDGTWKGVYQNDATATSLNQITTAYKKYLERTGGTPAGDTDEAIRQQMVNNNVWAFCSFDNDESTNLKSKTKITATASETSEGSTSKESGWNDDKKVTSDTVLTVTESSTISLSAQYSVNRDVTSFAINKIDKAVASSISSSTAINGLPASDDYLIPAFGVGVGTIPTTGYLNGKSATINTSDMTPDVEYTFCASHSQPGTITVSGTTTTPSGKSSSSACVKVKYVPVTADVYADSVAKVSDNNGTFSEICSSHVNGKDAEKTCSIDVGAGPINTISWAHNIGYDNLSGNVSNGVWTQTYNLQGGGALDHKLQISKYADPSTNSMSGYSWAYLNENALDYPSASSKHPRNVSENIGAFPGETYTESQQLKHPSIVNAGSGSAASGSTDKNSKVTINLDAKDIDCGYEGHSYKIGVDNPNDYRWLTIKRDGDGKHLTVGDGTDITSGEFWLNPKSQISITQVACYGSQIAVDASNKDAATRWTTNAWKREDWEKNADFSKNKRFELTTELNVNTWFDAATGSSKTGSHANQSFVASEIGIPDGEYATRESTPEERIANNYRDSSTSVQATIGNLGTAKTTTFKNPNGEAASITVKIPYNYSLNLKLDGGVDVLDVDEDVNFEASITSAERGNELVCAGANGLDFANCEKYATPTKPTKAGMIVFTLGDEFSYNTLKDHKSFTIAGDQVGSGDPYEAARNIKNAVDYELHTSIQDILGQGVLTQNGSTTPVLNQGTDYKINPGPINVNNYPVGTKICAAIAAYPSDSHDAGDREVIEIGEDQSAALTDSGKYTGFKVTCRTVVKRQTMSVEGNGVVTTGTITSSSLTRKDQIDSKYKVYTSWSEYQIIAGGKNNASSGAVTAYALNNTLTGPITENMAAEPEQLSTGPNSHLYLQSLGNKPSNMGGSWSYEPSGASYEAAMNWNYSETLMKNIIDKYGGGDSCSGDKDENNNYLHCIGAGDLEHFNPGKKDTLVIRSTGALRITNGSYLNDMNYWGYPTRLIIIAPSISIAAEVEEVNAWLIATGTSDEGDFEFNTCSGFTINEKPGNQNLLEHCNKALFINGPVIVKGKLQLPRTFGGGSVMDAEGKISAEPKTLAQRAEIFNYDPSVVEWAYKESQKNPHFETTYTETLAPRL